MTIIFRNYLIIILLLIMSLFFSVKILTFANSFVYDYHLTLLADSFLHGRLDIKPDAPNFPPGDLALFDGKYFLYFGPLPSLILVPAILFFGSNFPQNSLTIITAFLSFLVVAKMAGKFSLKNTDSLWIASFYVFGTVYSFLVLVNITAFQIQAIGSFFLLLALYEFLNNKRYFLIGLCLSLAMATRFTLGSATLFFILTIIQEKTLLREKIGSFTHLITPILLSLFLLSLYNFIRFNDIFQTGYVFNFILQGTANYEAARQFGIFSLHHIPINLYLFLFKGFDLLRNPLTRLPELPFIKADEWGLSIVFTSPLLLTPFLSLPLKKYLNELITIFFMAIPVFTYYGVGFSQFGYRYALDFYPILLYVLLKSITGKVTIGYKLLIVYSIFLNFFFMFSIWGKYPLFGKF